MLEEGTNKPIAGAIVVTRWKETRSMGIWDSQTVCVHVESTNSDAEGKYVLPLWWGKPPTDFTVYKIGYQYTGGFKEALHLKPFTGTRSERMEYLSRVSGSTGCGTQDESQKNLIPLRIALYEEAKKIAVTKEEKQIVNNLLQSVEWLELGSDKSWDNWEKRKRELQ